jgi:hypothetical protein
LGRASKMHGGVPNLARLRHVLHREEGLQSSQGRGSSLSSNDRNSRWTRGWNQLSSMLLSWMSRISKGRSGDGP